MTVCNLYLLVNKIIFCVNMRNIMGLLLMWYTYVKISIVFASALNVQGQVSASNSHMWQEKFYPSWCRTWPETSVIFMEVRVSHIEDYQGQVISGPGCDRHVLCLFPLVCIALCIHYRIWHCSLSFFPWVYVVDSILMKMPVGFVISFITCYDRISMGRPRSCTQIGADPIKL